MAEEYIRSQGGIPAFKGYGHDRTNLFPGHALHLDRRRGGARDPRRDRLKEGQVVSVDVGVKKDGIFR